MPTTPTNMDTGSVTIVALNALPVIDPRAGQRIGGLETFAWNLARGLAAAGGRTSFVVRSTGELSSSVVDGVQLRLIREPLRDVRRRFSEMVEVQSGFPWFKVRRWSPQLAWMTPVLAAARLKHRTPLAEELQRALASSSPGVVISLGTSAETATALTAARRAGHAGVLWFQSNADLDSRFFSDPEYVDPYGVRSADARGSVAAADFLIAQTEGQRELLRERAGRECAVIQNPVDLERFSPPDSTQLRNGVLWIGRYDRMHKRPLLALEIARRCPEVPFTFVINAGDDAVAEEFGRLKPPNVTVLPHVARDEMPDLFRSHRLFLSTGAPAYEGFPNVLLEAAATQTAIVSLSDFDGFLKRSGAGFAMDENSARAADQIALLHRDEEFRRQTGAAGRDYVVHFHGLPAVLKALRPILDGLMPPAPNPALS